MRCQWLSGVWMALLLALPVQASYVAGGSDWRPFTYQDEQGNLHGISIDIAQRVLTMAGIDARLVSYPVNRLQAMLEKGEIDLNYADSPQWNSPAELRRYVFSVPYTVVQEHLYFLADHPASGQPIERMNNLIIGMVRGYTYLPLAAGFADNRLMKLETSQDDALLKLLENKRVDAVAMVDDMFDALVVDKRLNPTRFRKGAQLSEAPLAFKLQLQHAHWLPKINQAIQALSKSGELERIRRTYLPATSALP